MTQEQHLIQVASSALSKTYTNVKENLPHVVTPAEWMAINKTVEKDAMMETINQVMGAQLSVKLSLMMVSLV